MKPATQKQVRYICTLLRQLDRAPKVPPVLSCRRASLMIDTLLDDVARKRAQDVIKGIYAALR